ncbi:MAG: hypothetical protein OEV35_05565 [Gallionellaceae bacterium]|nr:hypothetical protein [Gallionellaceae bacterium]
MIRLEKALHAWQTPGFDEALRQEIMQLNPDHLPLQQGLSSGNHVADTPITVLINSIAEMDEVIRVRAGILYQSIITGCSCADDPTPISEMSEYCEVQLDINKNSASTEITLVNNN